MIASNDLFGMLISIVSQKAERTARVIGLGGEVVPGTVGGPGGNGFTHALLPTTGSGSVQQSPLYL